MRDPNDHDHELQAFRTQPPVVSYRKQIYRKLDSLPS